MHPGDGKASVVPVTRSIKAQTTPSRERLFFTNHKKEQLQLPQLQIGGQAQRGSTETCLCNTCGQSRTWLGYGARGNSSELSREKERRQLGATSPTPASWAPKSNSLPPICVSGMLGRDNRLGKDFKAERSQAALNGVGFME